MSALVMILTAAMVIPGNGPEMVSGEVGWGPAPLDLSGEWEGNAKGGPEGYMDSGNFRLAGGFIRFQNKPHELSSFEIVQEGEGCLSVSLRGSIPYQGIYKWQGNNLLICFPDDPCKRPVTFRASEDQHLYILHRVKPRK
jgi:hypothetical protein